jgi:TolB protein
MRKAFSTSGAAVWLALASLSTMGCDGSVTDPPQPPSAELAKARGGTMGTILFASERQDGWQIWSIAPDGSNLARVTHLPVPGVTQPAVAPNGKRMAAVGFTLPYRQILVMDADGSNPVQLTFNDTHSQRPSWSQDGKRIAFELGDPTNSEIWVMNADGSEARNLTTTLQPGAFERDRAPAFSPNGKQIAFDSNRHPGGGSEIFVMNADGSDERRLTFMTEGGVGINDAVQAAWAPNGKQIAFSSSRNKTPGSGEFHIYLINLDGTGLRQVTAGAFLDLQPAWSPDGKHLTFQRRPDEGGSGEWEIYVVGLDGADPVPLTDDATALDIQPTWIR